ncbi:MAG TPA: NAD(P)-dependent oxidoreductase [Albidovulum sp.]|uniref:NAD-dependent epimerase/dehydratase family protein n=1 Tax=Albidovulum sp. TaxID=1872424 RepID=UPI002C11D4F6|nr:NAD(P)-dependent oxidoreductase [Albidovulum sp.]
MSAPRVLVTGATGLIGRHLAGPLARRGFEVVTQSRSGGDVTGDLLKDPEGVAERAGATHLIHLAWHDAPTARMTAPENLDWATASLRLLRAFAARGGKRAVMVGSCAEYDWTGAGRLSEDAPLKPATPYGAAKAGTGIAALGLAGSLGVSLVWARPFFIYGPGEPQGRLFGDILKGLAAGKTVDCTDGLQRRDFLHAADVAAALAHLLASDVEGPVNIGSGKAVEVREMIGTLARALDRGHLIRLGARPRPANDPALIEADVTRLASTGFRPEYSIESGIRAVLATEGVTA